LSEMFDAERRVCGMAYHIVCCLCILMCLGPILIIIGIIVLFSATSNTRANEVGQYNMAVTQWNNQYRAEFAAATGFGLGPTSNVILNQDVGVDKLNDGTTSDLSTYTPLKYTTLLATFPPFTYSAQTQSYNYAVTLPLFSPNLGNTTTQLPVIVTPFKKTILMNTDLNCKTTTTNCATVCGSYNGIWNTITLQCTLAQIASTMCVKVLYAGNAWSLSNENGGNGCGYTPASIVNSNFPYNNAVWGVEQYTNFNVPNDGSNVTLPAVTLIVRHARDPYIEASLVTGGSYNFGLTTGQTLALGFIIIIVGAVFLAPAILVTVLCVYCIRRNNY